MKIDDFVASCRASLQNVLRWCCFWGGGAWGVFALLVHHVVTGMTERGEIDYPTLNYMSGKVFEIIHVRNIPVDYHRPFI